MDEFVGFCYESVNRSCLKIIYPTAIQAPLYILSLTTIVLTVCGNLLVIISITHFKQLHTPTNCLILSLAAADFLLGVVIMPLSMVYTIETCWYFGDMLCMIHSSADSMLCNVSLLNLSFISIDRYYAVCQPLHYRTKITTCATVIMILVSWSVSALVGFGIVFLQTDFATVACVGDCFVFHPEMSGSIFLFVSFYTPAFIMLVIYKKIYRIAQKQARSIHSIAAHMCPKQSIRKSDLKATKTFAVIIGVFLSTWSSVFIYPIIDQLTHNSIPQAILKLFMWICYLNSTLNPIVYAFFYRCFRKTFQMIICGKIFQTHSSRTKLSID